MEKLLNHERALELLARERLDGLVAARPENSYYVSGYWGAFNTAVGYDGSYFAVLPSDPRRPAGYVLPALEVRRLETRDGTWMPEVCAYTSPVGDAAFEDGTRRGTDYAGWPVAPGAALQPLEERWVAITRRLGPQTSADARWALARALRAAGLERGHVLVDDARLAGWLADCGLTRLKCLYAPHLFNEVRMVKTAPEIERMRTAARLNEQATVAAADALREGVTWGEVEDVYMATLARLGGRGVYLMCGLGELPAGRVRRGEPVFLDALGQFAHYHADFGRCAVLGAPSAEHERRHACLLRGVEAALEAVRPGRRYSEVAAEVGAAVRAAGLAGFREPLVHGLGLEHTDDPKPHCVPPQTKPDQVLREDMVINVDMPHVEIGWGSVHMEDTVRVTATGCERLGTTDFALRVVA